MHNLGARLEVRFRSKANLASTICDVRFTPEMLNCSASPQLALFNLRLRAPVLRLIARTQLWSLAPLIAEERCRGYFHNYGL